MVGKMKEQNNIYLLFEKAARLYPDDHCLLYKNTPFTYKEVEEKVSKVHLNLIKHVKNEKIIGLPITRGIDQVIFMLAILKAGKAYLPIDFGYPKNRIQNIITNSNLIFCLSTKEDSDAVVSMGLKLITNNNSPTPIESNQILMAQNAAYILYTSGSTGEPKGVCMGQEALINLITWQNKNSTSKNGARTLQFAPLSFDVSFQEIMATLSTGGTLVLIDDALRQDMVALINFIKEQQVNRLFLPFVALQALSEAALGTDVFPNSLKEIMTAGEQLKITPSVNTFFTKLSNCVLYNQYGPTECHVVTELKLDGDPSSWPPLPSIGKPISNTSIIILNQELKIVNNGEIGELYIAGECLAEGYLNNKQLTNEKFLDWKSPEGKNIRVYRSGDIAKYLPDGNIEFLGRQDDQVKISGHRIELAEVELAINSLNGINQTIVLVSNHLGQTQLVAYIQSNYEQIDVVDIRKKISNILPNYMVPAYFMLVKDFPKTSSGKINKKALPLPEYARPDSASKLRKPRTKIEKEILQIWSEHLQITEIGIDDDFFEMGGNSIVAVKVMIQVEKEIGKRIPLSELFKHSTVEKFAQLLNIDGEIYSNCIVPIKPIGNKTPFFLIHGAGLNVLNFVNLSNHFDEDQPVYGIQGNGPKGYDEWYVSIEAMAAHYVEEIIKINPNGPYALSGFSFGGIVAFEMARQLKEKGKTISIIALLDTYVDSSYYYKTYNQKRIVRYLDRTRRRLVFLKEMLLSWRSFKLRFNAKKEYIEKQFLGINNEITEEESIAFIEFEKANSMVSKIVDQYHLKPLEIKVDLFRAKDDDEYKQDPTHLGWKRAALKGVHIHNIPGDHLDIVAPPNDKVLARMLQKILDERHIKI
jgi:amino acid adenylation domain-containing protein